MPDQLDVAFRLISKYSGKCGQTKPGNQSMNQTMQQQHVLTVRFLVRWWRHLIWLFVIISTPSAFSCLFYLYNAMDYLCRFNRKLLCSSGHFLEGKNENLPHIYVCISAIRSLNDKLHVEKHFLDSICIDVFMYIYQHQTNIKH